MQLPIQDYLRAGNNLDGLTTDLGIRVYHHPELPLVGFKYHQLDSPKYDEVVRSCRGTVLIRDSWNQAAVPFRRFFNAGEDAAAWQAFDWTHCTARTKEDGSLGLLYWYQGWQFNTSGSFGLQPCGDYAGSWRSLFWAASRVDPARLDRELTYVVELCTPHNRVVRHYPEPVTFLLSAFHNPTLVELSEDAVDRLAGDIRLTRPERHSFSSHADILAFLDESSKQDRTFEGVVIRDASSRFKIKSKTYLAIHHLLDNGNLFNTKRLVPLVLAGEVDEVTAVLPACTQAILKVQVDVHRAYAELAQLWESTRSIPSQKDFAQAIRHNPLSSILFQARRSGDEISTVWHNSPELIEKVLYQ